MELSFDQFLGAVNIIASSATSTAQLDKVQEANNIVIKFKEENKEFFLLYSAQIVLLPDVNDNQAMIAILSIKSVLRLTRCYGFDYINNLWNSIPEEQRNQLKQALLRGIMFPGDQLRNAASSTLALVAQLEYPKNWPEFFDILVQICQDRTYGSSAVMGVLQTLSDAFTIPAFIRPRYSAEREKALNIVSLLAFQVLQQDTPPPMKTAAVQLLTNSFKTTFFHNYTRNFELTETTIQALLSNFNVLDNELHYSIYEFFLITFKKIYKKIFPHPITEIAQAITQDLQSGNIDYQKMALSFLRKCAKHEDDIISKEYPSDEPNFTKTCSQNFTVSIVPFLVFINDTFEFDTNDDSLSYYTYRALKAFTIFDGEFVLNVIQAYFNERKADENWKVRCSAIIALHSVLRIGDNVVDYVHSIRSDLNKLAEDPNINVRLYTQSFIASFIKKYSFMEDMESEVQFVVTFASQLLQQEDKTQAISGTIIIQNFVSKFSEDNSNTPLSNPVILNSILNPLWLQFNRTDIINSKLDLYVKKAICTTCRNSAINTVEVRKEFALVVFNRIRESLTIMQEGQNFSADMVAFLSTMLEIFGIVIFTIRKMVNNNPENEAFIDEVFTYLSAFLPKMSDIPNLVKTIGNLIIAAGRHSAAYANALVKFLYDAQSSDNSDLILESALAIGDLFRSAESVMQQYAAPFCNLVLINIEKDQLPEIAVYQQMMTLGDIVKHSPPESIYELRDRLMGVVRNYTQFRYNPDDPRDVATMSVYFEGVIYLAGTILETFSDDDAFITNKNNIDTLFEFRIHIKPETFKSSNIDYSLILFLDSAIKNKEVARTYNIPLNHNNIKNYLKKIIKKSKNLKCVKRAKELRSQLESI